MYIYIYIYILCTCIIHVYTYIYIYPYTYMYIYIHVFILLVAFILFFRCTPLFCVEVRGAPQEVCGLSRAPLSDPGGLSSLALTPMLCSVLWVFGASDSQAHVASDALTAAELFSWDFLQVAADGSYSSA